MINMGMARARGLTKRDIKDLLSLHVAMDSLVAETNRSAPYRKGSIARKGLKTVVRSLEYQMQDKWKFDRDKARHTHWRRFAALRKNNDLVPWSG